MVLRPIIYDSDITVASKRAQFKKKSAPYYCLVSTLTAEGTGPAYRYNAYDLNIPKGLVKQARKKGLDKKWVTYKMADKYAGTRIEADPIDGGGLVRMARCRLPALPEVLAAVQFRLTKFGSASWVQKSRAAAKQKSKNPATDLPTASEIWDYKCTMWSFHWWCDHPNVVDPWNDPGCALNEKKCVEWDYVPAGGGSDPGGTPGGGSPEGEKGNDGDPCSSGSQPAGDHIAAKNKVPVGCEPSCEDDPTVVCKEPQKPKDCAGVEGGSAYIDECGKCVGGTTGKLSCCATLEDLINQVLKDEGGYTDHPNDDGGATNHGITENTWDAYAQELFGINPSNVPVSSITEQQARTIYREVYYPWSNARSVSGLDGDLGIFYFNMFVITPSGAVKSLQEVLVALGYDISIDGGMGPETLGAIQNCMKDGNLVELYNRYKNNMKEYWQEKITEDPENEVFENGWNNRTEDFPDKTNSNKRNVNCN